MAFPASLPTIPPLAPAAQARQLLREWHRSQPLPAPLSAGQESQFLAFCQVIMQQLPADFTIEAEDIRSTVRGALALGLATGTATGPCRAAQATQAVLAALPLPLPLRPAGAALLLLSSPPQAELQLNELTEIVETLQFRLGADTEMIFGHGEHPSTANGGLIVRLLAATHAATPAVVRPLPPLPASSPLSGPDPLLSEAARLVLRHGYGSSALLQRHLRTGYNRTGRLLAQLLQAGVVAVPVAGSRQYLAAVTSETQLLKLLSNLFPAL